MHWRVVSHWSGDDVWRREEHVAEHIGVQSDDEQRVGEDQKRRDNYQGAVVAGQQPLIWGVFISNACTAGVKWKKKENVAGL